MPPPISRSSRPRLAISSSERPRRAEDPLRNAEARRLGERDRTVIEIVNDDMPFLVDSVMGELAERRLDVAAGGASGVRRRARRRRQAHRARRARRRRQARAKASSISISRRSTTRPRAPSSSQALADVLGEVRLAVHGLARRCSSASTASSPSSRPIRRRCRSTRSPRRSSSCNGCAPTISPSSACATTRFDGQRARAGFRQRARHHARARPAVLRARQRAAGIHAGDHGVPQGAAAADHRQGQYPLARAPARLSRLHRRQALRRRRQPDRRIPHRRPVHLDRLHAHGAQHSVSAAQARRGRAARRLRSGQPFRQGAGQRARALSARRAVPDRRGHALSTSRWPSCSSTSGRACACWRGATASTASSRCWSSCRASATTAHIRVADRRLSGARLHRPRFGVLSVLPGRARWCACISSSAAPADRRREIERATLERDVAAIVRTWSDGLAEALALGRSAGQGARRCSTRYGDGVLRGLPRSLCAGGCGRRHPHASKACRTQRPLGVDFHHRLEEDQRAVGLKVWSFGAAAAAVGARAGAGKHGLPRRRRAHLSRSRRKATRGVWFHDMLLRARDGGTIDLDAAQGAARSRLPDGDARRGRERRLQRADARRRA